MTLRVAVVGARGRMGRLSCRAIAAEPDLALVAEVGRGDPLPDAADVDVLLDFGTPESAQGSLEWGLVSGRAVLVGATGLDADWVVGFAERARDASVAFALVPNFSLSAVLAKRFAVEAARYFESCEVVEFAHPLKREAPSGTALDTARAVGAARSHRPPPPAGAPDLVVEGVRGGLVDGVPVHSVRLAGVMSRQRVLLGNPSECLAIEFDAVDREVYMMGLLMALRGMAGHRGMVYGLEPFL